MSMSTNLRRINSIDDQLIRLMINYTNLSPTLSSPLPSACSSSGWWSGRIFVFSSPSPISEYLGFWFCDDDNKATGGGILHEVVFIVAVHAMNSSLDLALGSPSLVLVFLVTSLSLLFHAILLKINLSLNLTYTWSLTLLNAEIKS